MSKKYFDVILAEGNFAPDKDIREIHLSVKGKALASGSFFGMLIHKISPDVKKSGKLMEELTKENVIIYIDDIFDADDRTLLNPGLLALYIKEIVESSPECWRVILTKSIEEAKEYE